MIKRFLTGITALSLLSGCTAASEVDASSAPTERQTNSREQLETSKACRDIELQIINASIVFEDTLAYTGMADSKESRPFFDELNLASETLVSTALNEASIANSVVLAANLAAGDVSSVLGLASGGFNPSAVGKTLRSSIGNLFSACEPFVEIATSSENLFFAPELIEFSLEMTEDRNDEPLYQMFDKAYLTCDESMSDLYFTDPKTEFASDNPQSVLAPYIQSVCKTDAGSLLLRRHSSNLESLLAARKLNETLDSSDFVVIYSDRFSGMVWTSEDRQSELEGLASSYAYLLEMKILETEG